MMPLELVNHSMNQLMAKVKINKIQSVFSSSYGTERRTLTVLRKASTQQNGGVKSLLKVLAYILRILIFMNCTFKFILEVQMVVKLTVASRLFFSLSKIYVLDCNMPF